VWYLPAEHCVHSPMEYDLSMLNRSSDTLTRCGMPMYAVVSSYPAGHMAGLVHT
jgi:hypothetical protein